MRCKNCRDKFEPVRFNQKFCLQDECIKAFVEDVKQKGIDIYNPNQTKELIKEINENYPYLKLTTKRG